MLIYENAKFDMCSNDDDDYDSDYEDDIYWLFLFTHKFKLYIRFYFFYLNEK